MMLLRNISKELKKAEAQLTSSTSSANKDKENKEAAESPPTTPPEEEEKPISKADVEQESPPQEVEDEDEDQKSAAEEVFQEDVKPEEGPSEDIATTPDSPTEDGAGGKLMKKSFFSSPSQYFKRMNKTPEDKVKKLKTQIWSSVVTIVLIEGKKLLPMDDNGLSDPYVKFRLGQDRYKSKVGPNVHVLITIEYPY